ncbi:Glycosyltransferase involved in cell wall bisynthesis [Arachidicoccus rhizosphaerae]|uniref:Glycosyltransferase involved in cell wall bisynthesis n=1 Tax=Arachidicoccus rhizosphaerae TaxID=551991 RepID=A0A1H3VZR4_9BACT|nr:glycosyltransferase [Arachidicoccus rhizosphaerae]SDZ80313.1 Glycosyltransferase involved in cell wall bisynthesis [Arachidicoccus rhizosphaerae]
MNPVFSICVTTYNMAEFLDRAIQSILSQNFNFNIEVLICNDCSTDETIKILENYSKYSNFTIINNIENQGVLKSLSHLLKIAQGEYIALLDADDYWNSINHLQLHYEVYKTNSKIGFIFGNYLIEAEDQIQEQYGYHSSFKFPENNQFEFSLLSYPILTSTSSFRRALLMEEEIEEYIKYNFPTSDYGIYLGLMLKTKGSYLHQTTTTYNFRNNSQSRKIDIYARINHFIKRHTIADYFISKHTIPDSLASKREFLFNQKILLASWLSNNPEFIKEKSNKLSILQFLKYNPKATYIFIASKNKLLYRIFRPWVLRNRAPGK